MSCEPAVFTSNMSPAKLASVVHTADNSRLNISYIGNISTANLSLFNAFLVSQLTLNLISVGQLCELGFSVYFSDRGCVVQEPETVQIIGIGHRVGRLFELVSLLTPSKVVLFVLP